MIKSPVFYSTDDDRGSIMVTVLTTGTVDLTDTEDMVPGYSAQWESLIRRVLASHYSPQLSPEKNHRTSRNDDL